MIQQVDKPLTDKQQSFIEHYCTDAAFNATKAYILAGYSKTGADGNASRMIVKDSIKQAIVKKRAEISLKAGITVDGQLKKTEEHRLLAIQNNNVPAANTPLDMQNRYAGLYNADTSGSMTIVDIMAIVGIGVQEDKNG